MIGLYIVVVVQSLRLEPNYLSEIYSIKVFSLDEFHLYTYNKVKGVPKGTKIKDTNKFFLQPYLNFKNFTLF